MSRHQLLVASILVAGFVTPEVKAVILINGVVMSHQEANLGGIQSSTNWAEVLNTGSDSFGRSNCRPDLTRGGTMTSIAPMASP